jgi:hypothetical protein
MFVISEIKQMEDNKVGDVASRSDGKKEPSRLRVRKLRWIACAMLALSIYFYITGTDTMKWQSILGVIGAIIIFVFSFLVDFKREE